MMQLNAIDRLRQMQDNESFLKELEEAQSSADVIAVCGRYGLVLTDGEVEQLTREARPVMLSNRHPEGWHTYFHERYFENAACDSTFWSVWVGNMFDFGAVGRVWGEGKGTNDYGLVTFDRKDRKDAYYLYKANWNDTEPFVYITEKRRDTRSNCIQTIKVYSNQSEVELIVNNKSIGSKSGTHGVFSWEKVELRNGINRLEARSGWASDKSVLNIAQSR